MDIATAQAYKYLITGSGVCNKKDEITYYRQSFKGHNNTNHFLFVIKSTAFTASL
jgi:hypothetical protein